VDARSQRRVIVGVSASPSGLQALRYAVDQARERTALLVAVRTFRASGSGAALRGVGRAVAVAEVATAFEHACGGLPPGIDTIVVIEEGSAGRMLVTEASSEHDLLVIGGSGVRRLGVLRRATTARRCARDAICAVVIVPLPMLARAGRVKQLLRSMATDVDRLLDPDPTKLPAAPPGLPVTPEPPAARDLPDLTDRPDLTDQPDQPDVPDAPARPDPVDPEAR
jgi:Universal stress protein family